ncbi:MAG: hypothetical protein P1U74_10010 [Legionellaceae bacterium]|nr:hypothetical protein [Legionellaceae bacterium]
MKFKSLFAIAISLLTINISIAANNANEICLTRNCKLIIDAGSSGSRAHLYAYDKDENNTPINIDELYVNKATPGVSNVDYRSIGLYLDNVMQKVPVQNLEVYFFATAGMRLLPEEEQQSLYGNILQWFGEHPEWSLMDARTITGSEEGVFGWLATNYSLDLLDKEGANLPGFIEIGGASTQIVFPITNFAGIKDEDIASINFHGRRVSLFSHSFLGHGANEILKKFQDKNACFATGYVLPSSLAAIGDGRLCGREIFESINQDNSISDTVIPATENNPSSAWYTVGAASTISQKTPLAFTDNFTAETLLERADATYCKQDWESQKLNYVDDDYLNQNCLVSSLFYSLSVYGYGIPANQAISNLPAGKNGDWTLGALILGVSVEHHSG